MSEQKNDPRSLLMFVSSMLIFGSIGVFRRYIPLSSAFLAFTRGVLGGLSVWAFTRLTRGRPEKKLTRRQLLRLAFIGAVIGVNWILLFEAYERTTVSVATLCYYMEPTIVTLLSPAVFSEKLTGRKAACVAVAILGMILVSGVTGAGGTGANWQGVVLGLSAAVLYAAVVIMNKKTGGVDAYQKTTAQMLAAGLVMVPYLLLTGAGPGEALGARTVVFVLIAGLVHTGAAYLLYFRSMDGLKVQSIAILSYIDPVSALIFSAVFLKEPLSAAGLVGAAMIIGSAVVSEWRTKAE